MESKDRTQLSPDIYYYKHIILGAGTFGTVYKGIMVSKNQYVAVKKILISNEKEMKAFSSEMSMMKQLQHKNIVKFIDYVKKQEQNASFMVMELCEGGSLAKQIKSNGKIPEMSCLQYLKQIVDAMASVNSQQFIHRDLKADNILLTITKQVKICDFGVARKTNTKDPNDIQKMTNCKGTSLTMAPEVIISQLYSAKCDVWSVGIVLCQMLSGQNIFDSKIPMNWFQLFDKQRNLTISGYNIQGNYNAFFKNIIKQMVIFDQSQRLTMLQLKNIIDQNYEYVRKQIGFQSTQSVDQALQSNNLPSMKAPNLKKNIRIVDCVTPKRMQTQPTFQPLTPNALSPFVQNNISNQMKKKITEVQKQAELKSKKLQLLQAFKIYIEYLIHRYEVYIIVNSSVIYYPKNIQNYFNKMEKYILMGIFLALVLKSIEQIKLVLNGNFIKLPNGMIINTNDSSESFKEFTLRKKQFEQKISQREKDITQTLQKLVKQKLENQSNKQNCRETYQYFRQVIKEFKTSGQKKTRLWYEGQLKKFIFEYTWASKQQQNRKKFPLDFLGIYWSLVRLINIQQSFPRDEFQTEILRSFDDSRSKESRQWYDQQLERMGKLYDR